MKDKEKLKLRIWTVFFKEKIQLKNQLQIVIDLMFLIAWSIIFKETDFGFNYKFCQVPLVFKCLHYEVFYSENLGFILLFKTPWMCLPVKNN